MKAAAFVLLLSVSAAVPVHAMTIEEISALYARGAYSQAAQAGEASHTAAGLGIAAHALLAQEVLGDKPCLALLQKAESLATAAAAADPKDAQNQVWLAAALGGQARIIGLAQARLRDLPGRSRKALDAALAAQPKNPYALSALGGWNIEIVRAGGAVLAGLFYGASEAAALGLYDRSVALAPGNVAVHYQIALSLAGFDFEKYRARVATELKLAIAGTAQSAYQKTIQSRAQVLLTLTAEPSAFARRLRRYQGFP